MSTGKEKALQVAATTGEAHSKSNSNDCTPAYAQGKARVPVMSSLELVNFINTHRAEQAAQAGVSFPSKGFARLDHADFIKKVPRVLKGAAGNFSGSYRGMDRTRRPCYHFPKREACLMAMSYSYEIQALVFDRMVELETQLHQWQQVRNEGKAARRSLTDSIQAFISYAKSQGSTSAERYYMAVTQMEYAALELVKQASNKHFRDSLDAVSHVRLMTIELAANEALRRGMAEGLHYRDCFQMAKAACLALALPLRQYLPMSGRFQKEVEPC